LRVCRSLRNGWRSTLLAAQAAALKAESGDGVNEIVLRKTTGIRVDGKLDEWPMDKAYSVDAGAGRLRGQL